jgi:hypothetical protein
MAAERHSALFFLGSGSHEFLGLEQALAERLETQIHHDRDSIQSAEVAVVIYREALFKTRGLVGQRTRSAAFGQK